MRATSISFGRFALFATSILILTACSGGATAGGMPSSCQKSGDEYFRYAALNIRTLMVHQNESSFGYQFPQSEMRAAGASIDTWLSKNPECKVGAVEDLSVLLQSANSKEFTFDQVSLIQKVQDAGVAAASALDVSVPFDPSSPTSNANDPDQISRPVDVVAKTMPFDSDLMVSLIDLINAS